MIREVISCIAAAVSGGVFSSVAALLLTQAEHQAVGVTMKSVASVCTEDYPKTACCSLEAIIRAPAACHHLGIPHGVPRVIRASDVLENATVWLSANLRTRVG